MKKRLQMLVARSRVNALEPFVGSLACIALPTVARLALAGPLGAALPFATYFPTVLLATVLWGIRWGVAVLIGSGLVAGWLFVETNKIALFEAKGLAALGLFLVCGTVILWTGHSLRRALVELADARKADALRKLELQHRMKNSLAIVQSFSSYLSQKSTDVHQFHRLLEAKIVALATASEILFAEEFESCALPETAIASLAPFAQENRVSFSGPSVDLHPDCCEPLVLALHELATNAHKYGALSVSTGSVDLSWQVASQPQTKCVVRWVEKDGPLVRVPIRSGLGQYLLAAQRGLDAVRLNYEPTGLVCEIVVPLAQARISSLTTG